MSKQLKCIVQQLLIAIKEFKFHSVQVLDREKQYFNFSDGHYCELPLQQGSPLDPFVEVNFFSLTAAYYINHTELISDLDVDIASIVILRQHEACLSFDEEEYLVNIITLKVDILVFGVWIWLQQGTEPRNKGIGLLLEKFDSLVPGFVDV